jgi:23S rRNA (adenine2503-C2)-methyltransferase
MAENPVSLSGFTADQLVGLVASMGEPGYRAKQLQKWIYRKFAFSYDEMTDLPLSFRQKLTEKVRLRSLEILQEVTGNDGTVKCLFNLRDGRTVEAAIMRYGAEKVGKRHTVCVSTQAGCSIGCAFCATGQQGFERNLAPGEMVDQVLYFARHLQLEDTRSGSGGQKNAGHITNIVFMGMGEPLANYDNLWQAITLLNSPEGFGLGARNITVSTAGLVPQIKRLSRESLQIGLAVSLHAADNLLRNRLVPVNRKYPLEQLIPACREYSRVTGRRLSFEYILFNGINDSPEQARSLATLIKGINCHVNLIPANITGNKAFRPPPVPVVLAFENELKRHRVNVTLRESRGRDIGAGCGQLRGRFLKKGNDENIRIKSRNVS